MEITDKWKDEIIIIITMCIKEKNRKLLIPKRLVKRILKLYHNQLGHFGVKGTEKNYSKIRVLRKYKTRYSTTHKRMYCLYGN